MATTRLTPPMSFLSSQNINGVYISSILLVTGCLVVKREWTPFAAIIALGLAAYKFYDLQVKRTLKPKEFQLFPLKEKKALSHNTAIYRFKLPTRGSVLGLPIGQHISVKAEINGQNCMRSYTPISSDDDRGYFDLLIKSYPTGNISKLMGEMKIGDKLQFQGPKGAMVYTPNMMRHIGMIAGGTGITPMWQIIQAIVKGRPSNGGTDRTEVDLLFANVNPEDILMKKELDALAAVDKNFRPHYVLNNPPEGWTGAQGFVSADLIKSKFPPPAKDTKVLICGPPPMVKAMKGATESIGYEPAAKLTSKLPDQVFCF